MIRVLAAVACVVVAAEALGDEACAVETGAGACVPTRAAGDHSLLQVHPSSTVPASKKKGPSRDEPAKKEGTKLQQEEAVQGENAERDGLDEKVDDGSGSEAKTDPYPEDYDLDMDYPRDDKGTHADTIREVQSATLPGDGDIGRNTKPGLSDSWNVDQMFATDSDGGGDVNTRGMVPWGFRTQGAAKKESKDAKKGEDDKSGLLSSEEKAQEKQEKDGKEKSQDHEATKSQRHKSTHASKPRASETEHKAAPTGHHKKASAQGVAQSGEGKAMAAAAHPCREGSE